MVIANMVERNGMTKYISYLGEEFGSSQVVARGLGVVAEFLANEAERVQRGGLAGAIAKLTMQGKGPLTASDRLLVIAELSKAPAAIVESDGFSTLMAGSTVHDNGLLG